VNRSSRTRLVTTASNAKQNARVGSKQQRLRQLTCSDTHEQALRMSGCTRIAGVDEVGRGALFGPVVAAAVILPEDCSALAAMGLRDSKQLTATAREALDAVIRACAVAYAVAEVDAVTIDTVNIYQATRLAMLRAVRQLSPAPDHLLLDAMLIDHPCAQTKLIYGDAISLSIAAASVIAKVYRDALMTTLHHEHPQYGLAAHKGYGTPSHRRAILEHGPTPLHRFSFAPVSSFHADRAVMRPNAQVSIFVEEPAL
jgi:ribonuclease HII